MIHPSLYDHLTKAQAFCARVAPWLQQHNPDLLLQALTHKTFAADYNDRECIEHNERLEFLWDSILWAHVASFLYKTYPQHPESQLTLLKIYLVKEATLAIIARRIWLWEQIFLGNWEEKSGGRDKDSILSDALEAFIAYLFLQWGESIAEVFIHAHVIPMIEEQPLPTKSFKSKLQEYVQKHYQQLPEYTIVEKDVEESGNVLLYEAAVSVQWKHCWRWVGASKKKAQESAAQQAFESFTL